MSPRPRMLQSAIKHQQLFEKEKIYSVAQASEIMGINPKTIRTWISRGQLRALRIGKRKLGLRGADLESMISVHYASAEC